MQEFALLPSDLVYFRVLLQCTKIFSILLLLSEVPVTHPVWCCFQRSQRFSLLDLLMNLYNTMDFSRSYLINMSCLTVNPDNCILNTAFSRLWTHLRLISSRVYSPVHLKGFSKRLTKSYQRRDLWLFTGICEYSICYLSQSTKPHWSVCHWRMHAGEMTFIVDMNSSVAS